MQQAGEDEFNRALNIAFDNRLGLCKVESERLVFSLTGRYARQFAAHRLALVGDAAHTIHPLAGQGGKSRLMDAAELIAELKRLHRQGKDIGQYIYLRRYRRSRKAQCGADAGWYAGIPRSVFRYQSGEKIAA